MARPRLIRCKVVRPVVMFGRVAGSGETLYLDPRDADALVESGYVRLLEEPAIPRAGPWDGPTATR